MKKLATTFVAGLVVLSFSVVASAADRDGQQRAPQNDTARAERFVNPSTSAAAAGITFEVDLDAVQRAWTNVGT